MRILDKLRAIKEQYQSAKSVNDIVSLKSMYRRAINFYGAEAQKYKAREELEELSKEILRDILNNGRNRTRLLDEMSDVSNMIAQLMILHKVSEKELIDTMKSKMTRTMARIYSDISSKIYINFDTNSCGKGNNRVNNEEAGE